MEGDGVAFSFPLVTGPEFEEFGDPFDELFSGVVGVCGLEDFEDAGGGFFIADGGALDGVEEEVGHEVGFVGLFLFLGAKFGGG